MRIDLSTPVLVTGGASGLGRATAEHLHGFGAPVSVIDLPDAIATIETASPLKGYACDITDHAAVADTLARITEHGGVPRILVNCAGIAPAARTVSRNGPHDAEAFARVVAVNLIGSFVVASQVAARMADLAPLADGERGVIVNTASVAAYDGQIGQCAYAASKAGVAGMTLPMARDLASLGIRTLAIAPGIFATPMLTAMPPEVQQSLADQVPFPKRLGSPVEYAKLVQHIVENTMLNGEVIRLDGAIRMGAR